MPFQHPLEPIPPKTPAVSSSAPAEFVTAPAPYPRPPYAWAVVAMLVLAAVFSFIDRQIVAIWSIQ